MQHAQVMRNYNEFGFQLNALSDLGFFKCLTLEYIPASVNELSINIDIQADT